MDFFTKLLHYECTSCQLNISSHQHMVGYLMHPPIFDDWKWSTDRRYIRNEVTSKKIYTLVTKYVEIQKKTYLESLQVVNKNIWHPQIVDQIQIYWLKLIHIDRPRIQKQSLYLNCKTKSLSVQV